MTLSGLSHTLLDLLFPPQCCFCGRVQDAEGACSRCGADLPVIPEGQQERALADKLRCAAPFFYEGTVRRGILRLKFQGGRSAASGLSAWMVQCAADCFSGEFDTVTWVPISHRRLRRRGYDQSRLLAEAMCRRWQTHAEELLRKTGDNPAQSALGEAAARRANVLGMYEAVGELGGKRILLVDDIVTTGATLSECARVLRQAGAECVVCLALARTPTHKKDANHRECACKTKGRTV